MTRAARIAGTAAAVAAAGFVLAGALAFVPIWPCTLIEHFRLQYLIAGLAVVAAAAAFARRGWLDAALIAWLVDLAILVPDLGATARPHGGAHVRILFANVLASNPHHDRVAALIRTTDPDIVALVETRAPWFEQLAPALAGYAKLEHPRADNFGLGLYVKGTLAGGVEHLGGELPTIVATAGVRGHELTVVVTHPWPPVTAWAEAAQEAHLAAVAHRLRALPRPLVFAGDLNATPWSRVFRKLVGTAGLCDTRAGFGYQGSYPAGSVLRRIPIDHVLVSCDVGVRDRAIGPDVGSDHLPVIVDLAP